MRRGSRDVRDAQGPRARQELARRLPGTGEHQGRAGKHGAQIDLQSPIAANVVERAPHHGFGRWRLARQGAGETLKAVHHQFRHARGAGGEQDPLGDLAGVAPQFLGLRRRRDAVDHGIRFGGGAHEGELFGRQVRGAQHHPSRHAVELYERERGGQLLVRRQEHGAAAQRLELAAEYRAGSELLQRHRAGAAVKYAGRPARCNGFPQRTHGLILAAADEGPTTLRVILSK